MLSWSSLSRKSRTTLLALACPLFLMTFDFSTAITALPSMARSVGCDPRHLGAAMTSLMVVVAIVLPAGAWLSGRFGARRVLCGAQLGFAAGALLCAAAGSVAAISVARGLQGLGFALMIPVVRAALVAGVPRAELVAAMAWQSPLAVAGFMTGPLLAGWFATHLDWRWVFAVDAAVALVGVGLASRLLDGRLATGRLRLDARGLLLVAIALAGLMFGLRTLGHGTVPLPLAAGALVIGLCGTLAYARHMRRVAEPVLDLRMTRLGCYGAVFRVALPFRAAVGAVPFLLPLMLQVGLGWRAWECGLVMMIGALGGLPVALALPRLLRWLGFRRMLAANAVLCATMFALYAAFDTRWPAAIAAILMASWCLTDLQLGAMETLGYADVPAFRQGAATGLACVGGLLAEAVGIALVVAMLDLVPLVVPDLSPRAGLGLGYLLVALMALASAPLAWRIPVRAGDDLVGRSAETAPALADP